MISISSHSQMNSASTYAVPSYLTSTVTTMIARLPSNLRPSTRECVRLVKLVTSDKDSGHTIQSAVSKNPMTHANLMVLCFIEPELLPVEVLHSMNRDF